MNKGISNETLCLEILEDACTKQNVSVSQFMEKKLIPDELK